MYLRSFMMVITAVMLSACQSTGLQSAKPTRALLDDSAFPLHTDYQVETEEQVFALSDEAKLFVDEIVAQHDEQKQQIKALVHSIFNRSDFNLLYSSEANTIASETFEKRAANCLSMSIMTYALADYAGFKARMRDIDIPEYWTRREGFSLLNGHVNVLVEPADYNSIIRVVDSEIVIDFDPQESRKYFPIRPINKAKALAMFYNNKGADALIDGEFNRAYAYFRAAANTAPNFEDTWVNLGILYRRAGFGELAMQAYEKAIDIDIENFTAWENMAYLLSQYGEHEQAESIMVRLEKQRQYNPFYHFILGEQAFDDGDIEVALDFYQKAYRLDAKNHEILFGLGKSYYELGDVNRSMRFMRLAMNRAPNPYDAERYQGKLSKLQNAL